MSCCDASSTTGLGLIRTNSRCRIDVPNRPAKETNPTHRRQGSGSPKEKGPPPLVLPDVIDLGDVAQHRPPTKSSLQRSLGGGTIPTHRRWHSAPHKLSYPVKTAYCYCRRYCQFAVYLLTGLTAVLAFGYVLVYASHQDHASKSHLARQTLSTTLEYPCGSIWRQKLASSRCTAMVPNSRRSDGFDSSALGIVVSVSQPLRRATGVRPTAAVESVDMRGAAAGMRYLKHVFAALEAGKVGGAPRRGQGAQEPHEHTMLHLRALLRAREHISLHRHPRYVLIMEESSEFNLRLIKSDFNQVVSALPDDWSVLQLGISSEVTPDWVWDAMRYEWLKEGRPHVVVAPATLHPFYLHSTNAYLVHERGINAILKRAREDFGRFDLRGLQHECPGPEPGSISTSCMLLDWRGGVYLSTPPLFKPDAGKSSSQGHEARIDTLGGFISSSEQVTRWSQMFDATELAHGGEQEILSALRERMDLMANSGRCIERLTPFKMRGGSVQGWMLYSNPDASIGEQLHGLLSAWMLSLMLCRKFAAVLWDGGWAMDISKVFRAQSSHSGAGLVMVSPADGELPEIFIQGQPLSKFARTTLSWVGQCGCRERHREFMKSVSSMYLDGGRYDVIEVVSDCPFYNNLGGGFVSSKREGLFEEASVVFEQELNIIGVLSELWLKPTDALKALMPEWVLEGMDSSATQKMHVIGLQPVVLPVVQKIKSAAEMLSMSALLAPHGHPLGPDSDLVGSRPSEELMRCGDQIAYSNETRFVVTGDSPSLIQQAEKRFGKDRILSTRRHFSSYEELPFGTHFERSEMSIVWSLVDLIALSATHGMIADSGPYYCRYRIIGVTPKRLLVADDCMSRAAALISLHRHSARESSVSNHSRNGNVAGYVFWSSASSKSADRECFAHKTVFQLRNTPQWASPVCLSKQQERVPNHRMLERQRQAFSELPLESLNKFTQKKIRWWTSFRDIGKGFMFTIVGGVGFLVCWTVYKALWDSLWENFIGGMWEKNN